MIVTCTDIVARIKNLPEDYAEHVKRSGLNTAEVASFSKPTQEIPYTVWIKLTKEKTEGLRDVGCSCPATKLCDHIASFWAVAKGVKPDGTVEPLETIKPENDEGKKRPSEAIAADELQQFAIALREMKATVYAEIAALFDKLAKELQKMKAKMEDQR